VSDIHNVPFGLCLKSVTEISDDEQLPEDVVPGLLNVQILCLVNVLTYVLTYVMTYGEFLEKKCKNLLP